jgi:hypothetical protein
MRVRCALADPCEPPNSSTVFPAVVVVPEYEIVFGWGNDQGPGDNGISVLWERWRKDAHERLTKTYQ